jgi:6-phosphogluconate dehydrogenase
MENKLYDFGMIGLGVMGRNLLLNMADHGYSVVGFDKDAQKTKALESSASGAQKVKGVGSLEQMIQSLQPPRKMMMLVPAGKPVDDVIESLLPLLQKGDIVIDGGNSHYTDTLRRVKYLEDKGFHFMGVGISGGEKGARTGPSIMPGGDAAAYKTVQPFLEAVSAKVGNSPCVAYLGKGAAGHYVKMVHNGIEYAIMQLISETYLLLKNGLGLSNDELHELYKKWNSGHLQSFLVEITADIFLKQDDKTNNRLVDMVLDKAGSKGTGKWTSQDAMDLPVPVTVIDTAVAMRDLSTFKDERIMASCIYPGTTNTMSASKTEFISQLHDALVFATIICYAQGLAMLYNASTELEMEIPLPEVVRIWRGGCIIRSALLDIFYQVYKKDGQLSNILLSNTIGKILKANEANIRQVVIAAVQSGYSVAGLMSALAYFDGYRNKQMPTNLIQAQRDYFGAHTYQRIDEPGIFHSEWEPGND